MSLSYDISTTKVILIGVSHYEDINFPNIPHIQNNIRDLRAIFINPDYFGINVNNIVTIENKKNDEIIKLLRNEVKQQGFKTLIIYYAGHGFRADIKKLYLTGSNSVKDPHIIQGTGIDFDTIKSLLEQNNQINTRILILDACYSGIATQSGGGLFNWLPNLYKDKKEIQLIERIKGSYILSSSAYNEVSTFDSSKPEGYTHFTQGFINIIKNGLDNDNKQTALSLSTIFKDLTEKLPKIPAPSPQKKDDLNVSEFFFVKNILYNQEKQLQEANTFFENKHFEKALKIYERLDKEKETKQCKAEIEYKNRKWSDALESFKELQKQYPDLDYSEQIKKCEEKEKKTPLIYIILIFTLAFLIPIGWLYEKYLYQERVYKKDNVEILKDYLQEYTKGIRQYYAFFVEDVRIKIDYLEADKTNDTIELYQFIKNYPDEKQFTKIAQAKIDSLKERKCFNTYPQCDYLAKYPNGRYINEIKQKIALLKNPENKERDEKLWQETTKVNTIKGYTNYLQQGGGFYSEIARNKIIELEDDIAFNEALKRDNQIDLQNYIKNYPKGRHLTKAINKLNNKKNKTIVKEVWDNFNEDDDSFVQKMPASANCTTNVSIEAIDIEIEIDKENNEIINGHFRHYYRKDTVGICDRKFYILEHKQGYKFKNGIIKGNRVTINFEPIYNNLVWYNVRFVGTVNYNRSSIAGTIYWSNNKENNFQKSITLTK